METVFSVPMPRALEHINCDCDENISLCNLRLEPSDDPIDIDSTVSCVTCTYLEDKSDFCVTGKCYATA